MPLNWLGTIETARWNTVDGLLGSTHYAVIGLSHSRQFVYAIADNSASYTLDGYRLTTRVTELDDKTEVQAVERFLASRFIDETTKDVTVIEETQVKFERLKSTPREPQPKADDPRVRALNRG